MLSVDTAAYSTERQASVKSVGNLAMINADKLKEELEKEQEYLEELIMRTTEQDEDIHEMKRELQKLKKDIRASEDEDSASGVAQS